MCWIVDVVNNSNQRSLIQNTVAMDNSIKHMMQYLAIGNIWYWYVLTKENEKRNMGSKH